MELDLRVHRLPAQAGQAAVLRLAEQVVLGRREDQRVARGQVGPRPRADERLLELGERRVPVLEQRLGVELDLARRRVEADRRPRPAAPRTCGSGSRPGARTPSGWSRSSSRESPSGCRRTRSGLDVAIPEVVAETEARREAEHDLGVGARLAGRVDDPGPELHERRGVLADLEADLEGLRARTGSRPAARCRRARRSGS